MAKVQQQNLNYDPLAYKTWFDVLGSSLITTSIEGSDFYLTVPDIFTFHKNSEVTELTCKGEATIPTQLGSWGNTLRLTAISTGTLFYLNIASEDDKDANSVTLIYDEVDSLKLYGCRYIANSRQLATLESIGFADNPTSATYVPNYSFDAQLTYVTQPLRIDYTASWVFENGEVSGHLDPNFISCSTIDYLGTTVTFKNRNFFVVGTNHIIQIDL